MNELSSLSCDRLPFEILSFLSESMLTLDSEI